MTSAYERHRVLAGISRSRLLAVLRQAMGPMGIRELADAVDLHPNTAREHLDQLVDAGLVTREHAAPTGRGRPGLRYRAEPGATDDDPHAYRALASVLAGELARRPDAVASARSAGESWGRAMARGSDATSSEGAAVERLIELLAEAGFAPEASTDPGQPIRLRHCPFGSLAHERGEVVCGVHLGLMRGALRELGAPLDAVSLEPFVEPDLCLAHVGARTDD
jgi:predicted ArsR family transcriptional regulator